MLVRCDTMPPAKPQQSHPVCHQQHDDSLGMGSATISRDISEQNRESQRLASPRGGMLVLWGGGWEACRQGSEGRGEGWGGREVGCQGQQVGQGRAGQCPLLPEHHARAEHGHLPDRGSLVQPAKGKTEKVGRGEGKRGQRAESRARRSWSRAGGAQRMPWSCWLDPLRCPLPPYASLQPRCPPRACLPPGQGHTVLRGAPLGESPCPRSLRAPHL